MMADTLLRPHDPSALRRYGSWAEEPYTYGHNGTEPVAVKRLTWTCPAVAVPSQTPVTLTYFADATVESRRMNELAYLAQAERRALDTLEAMVLAATRGIAYMGMPHPVAEISQDVIALVGRWVDQRGHPDTWPQEIATTVGASIQRLNAWQAMLQHVGGAPDVEHPTWGMKVAIQPIEPKEDA